MNNDLDALAKRIRTQILTMTTHAGSGHPTSSLSATDLMTGLLFGGTFRFDANNPAAPNNDRLLFSKGHASPLFYALWAAAGKVSDDELNDYRKFGSRLEGHPTKAFPFTEAATGSLGQGLSIGVGMALFAKYLQKLPYRTYVLLGDSEMAEGSQWEAMGIASYYKLDNLIGIIDVNRLGQRGETMEGYDVAIYRDRASAFGWEPVVIDGHHMPQILQAYEHAKQSKDRPVMIIAKTVKGKGVSFIENKNGWHGKPLKQDELAAALKELGPAEMRVTGRIPKPDPGAPASEPTGDLQPVSYSPGDMVATRHAYGTALARIRPRHPDLVVLDGEVGNSTYAELFQKAHPGRFFEMYIAEQNMVGTALGLSLRGAVPFVSTFAAFFSRAFDQIRMSRYSNANIKFCGSHAGVSIGEDGSSQMGLEDIAMFRTVLNSVVLYPSDAVATEKLVEHMAGHNGISYLRTTRKETPVIYGNGEEFPIGGCKVLRSGSADAATVVAAGITLHEALAAYDLLKQEGISVRVIDLYSIKPIDGGTLMAAAKETGAIVTVEDHYAEGGLGEAVAASLAGVEARLRMLAVRAMPKSGKPAELMSYEGIDAAAIAAAVRGFIQQRT